MLTKRCTGNSTQQSSSNSLLSQWEVCALEGWQTSALSLVKVKVFFITGPMDIKGSKDQLIFNQFKESWTNRLSLTSKCSDPECWTSGKGWDIKWFSEIFMYYMILLQHQWTHTCPLVGVWFYTKEQLCTKYIGAEVNKQMLTNKQISTATTEV